MRSFRPSLDGWSVGLGLDKRLLGSIGHSQASVAFFRSRFTPIRGKPRIADWTIFCALVSVFAEGILWVRLERRERAGELAT